MRAVRVKSKADKLFLGLYGKPEAFLGGGGERMTDECHCGVNDAILSIVGYNPARQTANN